MLAFGKKAGTWGKVSFIRMFSSLKWLCLSKRHSICIEAIVC
jgi:hypothetical protein